MQPISNLIDEREQLLTGRGIGPQFKNRQRVGRAVGGGQQQHSERGEVHNAGGCVIYDKTTTYAV